MNLDTLNYVLGLSGVIIMILIGVVGYFLKKDTTNKEKKTSSLENALKDGLTKMLDKMTGIKDELHEFKAIFIKTETTVEKHSEEIKEMKKDIDVLEERMRGVEKEI